MTLTLLLLIFLFIAFFSVLTIILATVKRGVFQTSLLTIYYRLHFIFTNWILYLTSFYTLFPEKINGFLFLPIWFFLCILGFITFGANGETIVCSRYVSVFFPLLVFIWFIVVSSFGDVTVIRRIKSSL